jgi:hypothetical protein
LEGEVFLFIFSFFEFLSFPFCLFFHMDIFFSVKVTLYMPSWILLFFTWPPLTSRWVYKDVTCNSETILENTIHSTQSTFSWRQKLGFINCQRSVWEAPVPFRALSVPVSCCPTRSLQSPAAAQLDAGPGLPARTPGGREASSPDTWGWPRELRGQEERVPCHRAPASLCSHQVRWVPEPAPPWKLSPSQMWDCGFVPTP